MLICSKLALVNAASTSINYLYYVLFHIDPPNTTNQKPVLFLWFSVFWPTFARWLNGAVLSTRIWLNCNTTTFLSAYSFLWSLRVRSAEPVMSAQKFVAALDVGTTTIRCFIYDKNVQIRGTASEKVCVIVLLESNRIY